MNKLQFRSAHIQPLFLAIIGQFAILLIPVLCYGPSRVFNDYWTSITQQDHPFLPFICLYVFILLLPFLNNIIRHPLSMDWDKNHIHARYLYTTISLEMRQLVWTGPSRNQKSMLVFGNGALLHCFPVEVLRGAELKTFSEKALTWAREENYTPLGINKNLERFLPVLKVLMGMNCLAALLFFSFFTCLFVGTQTSNIALITSFLMIPVTILLTFPILRRALEYLIPLMGTDWNHLCILLVWSRFHSPDHHIESIILHNMMNNLDPTLVNDKTLQEVNYMIRYARTNPVVRDLIPLFKVVGDHKTLQELRKLQAIYRQKGDTELFPEAELNNCIMQLEANLSM